MKEKSAGQFLKILDMSNKQELAEAMRDALARRCGIFIVKEDGSIAHVDHEVLAKAGLDAFKQVFARFAAEGEGK